jgi:hypothetical protein
MGHDKDRLTRNNPSSSYMIKSRIRVDTLTRPGSELLLDNFNISILNCLDSAISQSSGNAIYFLQFFDDFNVALKILGRREMVVAWVHYLRTPS